MYSDYNRHSERLLTTSQIGIGAARAVISHFSVMAGDIGSLFNAGPQVVEGATFEEGLTLTDLGGPGIHCMNGTIDNLAANEAECFEQIRKVLSYLPNCGQSQLPPVISISDPIARVSEELRTVIPRKRQRMYDARVIIKTVFDAGSWFEVGALWGRTAIVGLARLGGRPVGVISLNCEVNSGALDAGGSQKITRHLKLCDVMNLPIVQFVDVPGYAIGTVAEKQGERTSSFIESLLTSIKCQLPCVGELNSERLISQQQYQSSVC